MDSSRIQPLAVRLGVLFLAAAGAQLAWRADYMACFALCLGLMAWAGGRIIADALDRRERDSEGQSHAWSALMEREREARRLTAFLDHAPVPLLTLRGKGAIRAINLPARRLFSTDDVVVDAPEPLLAAILGADPGVRRSLTLDLQGGPRAYALTVAEVVSDDDFVRIVALVDIQAEVQAAEAAALRELMQVLSHEIMNSLTPVTSLAQSTVELLRDVEDGDGAALGDAREGVESLARRAEGLLRFVAGYRALARLPEPRLTPVDVAQFVEDLERLFRSRWSADVDLEVSVEPMAPAMLDRDLAFHAVLNVLTNAAEAARTPGTLPRVILIARRDANDRLAVEVRDNGTGVSLTDPQAVFRPFVTTKAEGTGIGLAVTRQATLAHGGDVALATGPEGSIFTLKF